MQDAEKILSRFPGPVKLYPSRLRVAGLMLLSVGGVVVLSFYVSGNYRVHAAGAYNTFISWASLIVLAALVVGLLVQLLSPTVCLILDAEGFEIRRFAGSERVRWRDVRSFDISTIPLPRSNLERVAFETAKGGGALPNNYGLGLQDLLRLMKAWRERAISGTAA
jgi:hypothetical protein